MKQFFKYYRSFHFSACKDTFQYCKLYEEYKDTSKILRTMACRKTFKHCWLKYCSCELNVTYYRPSPSPTFPTSLLFRILFFQWCFFILPPNTKVFQFSCPLFHDVLLQMKYISIFLQFLFFEFLVQFYCSLEINRIKVII